MAVSTLQQQKRGGLVAGDSKGCEDSLIQGTMRPRPLMRMKIKVFSLRRQVFDCVVLGGMKAPTESCRKANKAHQRPKKK